MKYQVIKVSNDETWDHFVTQSPEQSIFATSIYLSAYDNIERFFVMKGETPKAGLYLPSDGKGNIISKGFLIHSGILFEAKQEKTNSKYNLERFELTEFFVEFIVENYKDIQITLSPNVIDIRPFLWHNYHEPNQGVFSQDVRYTSYIDISDINEPDSLALSMMDGSKRRFINIAEKQGLKVVCDYVPDVMEKFHANTMKKSEADTYEKSMLGIMDKLNNRQLGFQYTVYREDIPTYTIFFSVYNGSACYLFGAGDLESIKNNDATFCFWSAFKELRKLGVVKIDMEGLNSPQRGVFKIRFGGNIVPYFTVKKSKII